MRREILLPLCKMPPFSTSDVIVHILHYEANPMEKVINGLLDVGHPSPGVSTWVKVNVVALETPHGIDHESPFSGGVFTFSLLSFVGRLNYGMFPLVLSWRRRESWFHR